MNVQANARASAAIRSAMSIPVLSAAAYTGGDAQTRVLLVYATFPSWAPTIVDELEAKARYWRLDATLSRVLRTAKATVNRIAHSASMPHVSSVDVHPTPTSNVQRTHQRRPGKLSLPKPVLQ